MSVIAEQIAEQIEGFLKRRKLQLGIPRPRLASQILQYMDLRRKGTALTISNPKFTPSKPEDWDDHAEEIWQDWFSNEVHLSEWLREVFRPVFGLNTSACSWDYGCDGWREEWLAFLPWWACRTWQIASAYDATPYESDEEHDSDMDPRSAKIDPYLADHVARSKLTKTLN